VSGAPFAALAWVRRGDVRWVSGKPTLARSSPIASRGFCRRCGTPLLLQYDDAAETALMLGAFDRPDLLVPTYHYGVESRLPWIDCASGLPARPTKEKFAGQPP
jgi:hypothetical protein